MVKRRPNSYKLNFVGVRTLHMGLVSSLRKIGVCCGLLIVSSEPTSPPSSQLRPLRSASANYCIPQPSSNVHSVECMACVFNITILYHFNSSLQYNIVKKIESVLKDRKWYEKREWQNDKKGAVVGRLSRGRPEWFESFQILIQKDKGQLKLLQPTSKFSAFWSRFDKWDISSTLLHGMTMPSPPKKLVEHSQNMQKVVAGVANQ